MNEHLPLFASWASVVMVLLGLTLSGLVIHLIRVAGRLLRESNNWTGPAQHARIKHLEMGREEDRRRVTNLEENTGIQFRGLVDSIEGVHRELRQLSANVAALSGIRARVEALEAQGGDHAQDLQFMKDLGCGFKDCPRWKDTQPEPAK